MENKNTAWFNEDELPTDMIKGAIGEKGWAKLEDSIHFKVLNQLFLIQAGENVSEDDPSNLDFRFYRIFEPAYESPKLKENKPHPGLYYLLNLLIIEL